MQTQNNWSWNNYAPLPHYEIIEVNGEESARKIRMAPNSKTFLLEKNASIVWLAETDGVGDLTLRPYDLVPHQQAAPIDLNDLMERVKKLEDMYVQQSDTKQSKKQRNSGTNNSTD